MDGPVFDGQSVSGQPPVNNDKLLCIMGSLRAAAWVLGSKGKIADERHVLQETGGAQRRAWPNDSFF